MTTAIPADARRPSTLVPDDAYVLPEHLSESAGCRGPRFGEDVWDFRPFLPRSMDRYRLTFIDTEDPVTVLTVKEYLYSRLRRGTGSPKPGHRSGRPMKLTNFYSAFWYARSVITTLQDLGVPRLAAATRKDFKAALEQWKKTSANAAALHVLATQHLFAHGAFLSADRLAISPWAGRSALHVAGLKRDSENSTLRIPEYISSPLLKAAVFYVETASRDILAARRELADLKAADKARGRNWRGTAKGKVAQYIDELRASGRPVPALPYKEHHTCPDAEVVDGVVQAPNARLAGLQCGVIETNPALRRMLSEAAKELGYGPGGLHTAVSLWPDSGKPWRAGLGPRELREEIAFLRTACWLVLSFLSGMRGAEVRELGPDCAFTGAGEEGRARFKIRGRVFKGRALSGDEAEWVVLEIVHRAVAVLRQLNDDPTHLFGYRLGDGFVLAAPTKGGQLDRFRDHVNELFSTADGPFIPNERVSGDPDHDGEAEDGLGDDGVPWSFDSRQFRRTLAWYIAHQPFGIVAGARQFQHAKITMFEGYAGTSASGFAAEVATEEAIAKLDYVEDLYRDWNEGGGSTGGAAKRIDAEFERIRRELGDLPGVVASPSRLRTMLKHLTKTLHPGVLNDCFYQSATAVCRSRATALGRPLPLHNMCLSCPNARRSAIHLPRLITARDQAARELETDVKERSSLTRLQIAALSSYAAELDEVIDGIHPVDDEQEKAEVAA
ncbi:hypothetical protein [Streptomyces varsoviensis]|uniref:Integrase n=1 Tax=Streptomyces varsoviensis TaxID=67373 RepID=A0ABR5J7M0_9ACTN|nr:hypothetical protein [Streptomyces varsoviensis]KOG89338.1 hypothetical protein ADK38_14825 [Streptomyces varsoviensis]